MSHSRLVEDGDRPYHDSISINCRSGSYTTGAPGRSTFGLGWEHQVLSLHDGCGSHADPFEFELVTLAIWATLHPTTMLTVHSRAPLW